MTETKEEFEQGYAERSGMTLQQLRELGRHAERCECGAGCVAPATSVAEGHVGLSVIQTDTIGRWIIPGSIKVECRHAGRRPTLWQQLWHRWLLGWVWEDAKKFKQRGLPAASDDLERVIASAEEKLRELKGSEVVDNAIRTVVGATGFTAAEAAEALAEANDIDPPEGPDVMPPIKPGDRFKWGGQDVEVVSAYNSKGECVRWPLRPVTDPTTCPQTPPSDTGDPVAQAGPRTIAFGKNQRVANCRKCGRKPVLYERPRGKRYLLKCSCGQLNSADTKYLVTGKWNFHHGADQGFHKM